ncbi:MAG TPA: hypothetical protein VF026_12315 [Ktedonobacteraceae bacterium]
MKQIISLSGKEAHTPLVSLDSPRLRLRGLSTNLSQGIYAKLPQPWLVQWKQLNHWATTWNHLVLPGIS